MISGVGGLVGENEEGWIQNSYNSGNISGENVNYAGGIVGYNDGKAAVLGNIYNTGNIYVSSSDCLDGIAGAN